MRDKMSLLLNDEVEAIETVEFMEPDVRIVLNPKYDRRNSGEFTYYQRRP